LSMKKILATRGAHGDPSAKRQPRRAAIQLAKSRTDASRRN
jgi:hypothetical protein